MPKKPLIWCLHGARLGDNFQVSALADALGWPQQTIRLNFNASYRIPNFLLGQSLMTLQASSKSQICAPWPDLVICAGRRGVPVARWIKARSGGRCKIIQLGRPRAALRVFDLVVTTPQYNLPDGENIIQNLMPLSTPPTQMSDDEQAKWLRIFSDLPRPWTGVLVGGSTWPFVLDAAAAADLGRAASLYAAREAGALLLASGPRTSASAATALAGAINVPVHMHTFGGEGGNPYTAMLAFCDAFIVTGDSVSMISEACKTGKPVLLFDVPRRKGLVSMTARMMEKAGKGAGLTGLILKQLAASGVLGLPRNVARFHSRIIQAGYAGWLGAQNKALHKPPEDELAATVHQIKMRFDLEN